MVAQFLCLTTCIVTVNKTADRMSSGEEQFIVTHDFSHQVTVGMAVIMVAGMYGDGT